MEPRLDAQQGLHAIRNGVVDTLSDDELLFSPGGANPTFGDLLTEAALLEQSYSDSLHDLRQLWSERSEVLSSGVGRLKREFERLDESLEAAFRQFSADDWQVQIARPDGTKRTRAEQVEIYSQAMLILLGKSVVYLKAMDRSLPEALRTYIG